MCMKNRGMLFMFSELMVGGAILLLAGMGGTAWAVPVNASHHATSVQTTSPETLGMTDLFGPGVSGYAADREGVADFSANNLPQVHHLKEPPKSSGGVSTSSSPLVVGVPDGGMTAMMLGAVFGGMTLIARRTVHFKTA